MAEINENLELEKYYTNMRQDILAAVASEETGGIQEEEFTRQMIEMLEEAGDTLNARECRDIKENSIGHRIHKINGYALSEGFENLDLFVTIYKGTEKPEKVYKDELTSAVSLCTRFLKTGLNRYMHEIEESSPVFDLASALGTKEVSKELVRVNIFILSDGIVLSDGPKDSSIGDILITHHVRDLDYFFRLHNSKSKRLPIEINFESDFGGAIPCISLQSENPDYKSYLAVISGETLSAIYQNYGSRLLEQNVRSFLEFTGKINKGIRETILKQPHMFLAYNNGIAATAENVELTTFPDGSKGIKTVRDLQIVNGGQTTASIFHTKRKDKADVSGIFVQLKLSEIKNVDKLSEIVSHISEYANTQNKVSAADLTSNNPFHIELEKLSRSIWTPALPGQSNQTRWFYERARGQYKDAINRAGYSASKRRAFEQKTPKRQLFSKEDVGKFQLSWDMKPWFVVRGRQKNYAEFMKSVGKAKPDNIFFEDLIAKAIIFQNAEKIYGVKPNAIGDMRYITVPYAIAWISHKTAGKYDLFKVWRTQKISEELRIILKSLMTQIDAFIRKNAPGALYGEWAKKEECWNLLKAENFKVEMGLLAPDFAESNAQEKRYKFSNAEAAELERKGKQEELFEIPAQIWKDIENWGFATGKLSQFQRTIADHLSTAVKRRSDLTDIQLEHGKVILDIVFEQCPELLNNVEEVLQREEESLSEHNEALKDATLVKAKLIVQWDKRARKLSDKDFLFLKKIAESDKEPNTFLKSQLLIILRKARARGFSEN
jgi:hypothetical protein